MGTDCRGFLTPEVTPLSPGRGWPTEVRTVWHRPEEFGRGKLSLPIQEGPSVRPSVDGPVGWQTGVGTGGAGWR
jgi:hypothetical protein